jgi:XrtJ-associated TM-motif-TM protein
VLPGGHFSALTFNFRDGTFPIEDNTYMKKSLLLFGFAFLLSVALPLHAQDGGVSSGTCDDSPENPTAILAVIGSAGAFVASARVRIKARRNSAK